MLEAPFSSMLCALCEDCMKQRKLGAVAGFADDMDPVSDDLDGAGEVAFERDLRLGRHEAHSRLGLQPTPSRRMRLRCKKYQAISSHISVRGPMFLAIGTAQA